NTDGSPDPSLGDNGLIITTFAENYWGAGGYFPTTGGSPGVVVTGDGRILTIGSLGQREQQDFALVAFRSDGSLDTSFGWGGVVTTDFGAEAPAWGLALQPDGKIAAVGTTAVFQPGVDLGPRKVALARYLPSSGSPDVQFVVGLDHSLWKLGTFGSLELSPAGSIEAISASTDPSGAAEVFALASDHSLWVRNEAAWTMLSPAGSIS